MIAWLEISLTVDGEMAEAVAEVLARFIPAGIVIESTQIIPDPNGEGSIGGPLRVYGYIVADENLESTRQQIEEALWYLGRIAPLPEPQFRPVQDTNWLESWKQHYRPIPIGQRLLIVPAWLENPPSDRVAIRIDPGMAFGTGAHPTTQLCLEMLETYTAPGLLPAAALDIGCGSGILAIAAHKLGVQNLLAVDIDPQAVAAARENAALNGVAAGLELARGSVSEVCSGAWGLRAAPLVLANILAPVIINLFTDGLADLVAPGGVLILSGILDEQAPAVLAASETHGLALIEKRQSGDWVALAVRKSPDPLPPP